MNKTYYTDASLQLIESQNAKWVYLCPGTSVPPIFDGSFNHLVWDILRDRNGQDLLISTFFADAFEKAQDAHQPIVYIDPIRETPAERAINKVNSFFSKPNVRNPFLQEAARVIRASGCSNIILWDSLEWLADLRRLLPNHTIAFAQRHYDYPVRYDGKSIYDDCDLLITQTRGQTKLAFERCYRLTPFTVTIPNGVELDYFSPVTSEQRDHLRAKLNLPVDKFIVIFPSKLIPHKGTRYLLYWINYYQKKDPDIFFLIAGQVHRNTSPNHRAEIEQVLLTSPNVKWVGMSPRGDMKDLYNASDVCLMPGMWREGFSMAAIEALASGLPVVATQAGCYSEIIKNDYNGILCRPEYIISDVIQALCCLKNDVELCQKISKNARSYSEQRLSRSKVLANFGAFLENRFEDIDDDISIP